jgi:uncharacterized cupin superfamily protein
MINRPDSEINGRRWLATAPMMNTPSGPTGAHLVRNKSESTARVAMFSSKSDVGAVVYPDSEMVWMRTPDDAANLIVERRSALDDAAPWIAS